MKNKSNVCDEFCTDCRFYETYHMNCGYILIAGHSRGCAPGTGCICKQTATKSEYKERRDTILENAEAHRNYRVEKQQHKIRIDYREHQKRLSLFRQGMTDRQIADAVGRHPGTIKRWRHAFNLGVSRPKEVHNDTDTEN